MKEDNNKDWVQIFLGALGIALIIILFCIVFSSCRTTKSKGYTKDVYDSLYAVELEQRIKVLEIENGELTARVNELEFLGVEFNPNCDSILKNALLKAGCNTDSINAILNLYKSKIKVFADGSMEAEGFIKSLRKTKERNEEIISKYQHEIDSLKLLGRKEVNLVKTVTITNTVKIKRGWPFWVWLLIGYGLCILLPPQRVWQYIKIGVTKLPFRK